ncbi:uncharacterized protein RB166_021622 [Leptodactylus fuscus]
MKRNTGLPLHCIVRETDHNGEQKYPDFTYNCTGAFRTSTTPASIPSSPKLTDPSTATFASLSTTPRPAGHRRAHTCAIAALVIVVLAFLLLVACFCQLKCYQGTSKNQTKPDVQTF